MNSEVKKYQNSLPISVSSYRKVVWYSFDGIYIYFDFRNIYTIFSSQNQAPDGIRLAFNIVVRGTNTAGAHTDTTNLPGTTVTATVITVCNQGDAVQVIVMNQNTIRWGTFEGMKVSAFSGTLLSAL